MSFLTVARSSWEGAGLSGLSAQGTKEMRGTQERSTALAVWEPVRVHLVRCASVEAS